MTYGTFEKMGSLQGTNMNYEPMEQTKNKLNKLAWLMDSLIQIPGTNIRIGLDGIIGLLPGVGDIFGAVVSSYIIAQAAQIGAPKSVLLKMGWNVGLDTLFGAIPLVGDLTDFVWKANQKNILILNKYLENPQRTATHSRIFISAIVFVIIGVILSIGVLSFLLLRWFWNALQVS